MRYNALIALCHYLLKFDESTKIVCGFATTSGKQGTWDLDTHWLYADHTEDQLAKWLNVIDTDYVYHKEPLILVVNIRLSNGTQHRFDASYFYTPTSTWHYVESNDLLDILRNKETHRASVRLDKYVG